MNNEILRLRMFAGPNGSGKSTFKSIIRPELLGIFINPDEIEQQIQQYDFLDLESYQVNTTEREILDYFINSSLLKKANLTWSSKLTHLVKQLFSLPTISLQTDSDSYNRGMNANDNCYKTSKCSLKRPVALHNAFDIAAIAHALA